MEVRPIPTVRVHRKEHGDDVIINESDFDPALHEMLDVEEPEDESEDDDSDDAVLAILDGNVEEVSTRIAKVETVEELALIENGERAGKNRAGVIKAIEKQVAELAKE